MRFVINALVLLLCLQATAQQKGFRFQSSIQAGLLEGERGSAFQLHTIQGVQYKTWSAGVGAGLDYYHTRTIPLYVTMRKALWNAEKTPFLYLSGGYHFPWLKEENKNQFWWGEIKANRGMYYDVGIGYQLPVMKKSALYFTAGFSQKDFSIKQSSDVGITIWPMPSPQTQLYEYNLRRLSIQTGLRF